MDNKRNIFGNSKNKTLVLTTLAVISVMVLTTAITYAFFNYAKEGTTDNTITTGSITFLYTEVSGVGRGISIEDAYPISDSVGKVQTGEGKVFDFKVTSTTPNSSSIGYEVTARKKDTSTVPEDAVKLYLTKVEGDSEEEVILSKYNELTPTTKVDSSRYNEKTLYKGKVPANTTDYEQAFRLRMWIDEETNFSDGLMNDKEFTVTVNVYANAKVVTDEDIENESKAEISSLSVGGTELTKVEGQDYDYETTLSEGTTSTTINIETESEYATVKVEKIDNLAYSSNIKRLSTKKIVDLVNGDNYFKVTVTSENKKVTNEYKLKVTVEKGNPTLSEAIFSKYTTIYNNPTLTDSSNNTSDPSGLYKSTATNSGDPTYYFRGNVENYLDFAGFTWRVVRINEDGTIRIIMQDGINNNYSHSFNSNSDNKDYMYYTNNSNAKSLLESWYSSKIISNSKYSNRVATGKYYCEQAKVALSSAYATNSGANMTVYNAYENPNFQCTNDVNGHGLVDASIGLISYDEVLHAGGYVNKTNDSFYMNNNTIFWTMSPSGFSGSQAFVWLLYHTGYIDSHVSVWSAYRFRPVLNLKSDTTVTGLGTSDSHWVVAN